MQLHRVLAPIGFECPGLVEGYLELVNLANAKENFYQIKNYGCAGHREVTGSRVMLSFNTLWMHVITSN